MGIDVGRAHSQANMLGNYSNQLRDLKNKINSLKNDINSSWQAEEMKFINMAFDTLSNSISSVSTDLEYLKNDIITTANEIKREEEARAAAARAAAAAASKSSGGKK